MDKLVVLLFRADSDAMAPDETAKFVFAKAAKEFARSEVDGGRAKKAIVKNRAGDVILTYPRR